MVDDHTKANDELKSMAGQKKVALPTALSAKDMALRPIAPTCRPW